MAFNWGQGLIGAGTGAMAGSSGGIPGMVAGGVLGGGIGGFGSGQQEPNKLPTMSPEQESLFKNLLQMLSPGGQLGQGYGQGLDQLTQMMDPSSEAQQRFADPYMRQFNQQTVPGLAERFAGAGGSATGGALSSSGFGQALGGAGADLQSNLAALKSQLQQSAIQQIMEQYQTSLGKGLSTDQFAYTPRQEGAGTSLFKGYAEGGFQGADKFGENILDLIANYAPGSVV